MFACPFGPVRSRLRGSIGHLRREAEKAGMIGQVDRRHPNEKSDRDGVHDS